MPAIVGIAGLSFNRGARDLPEPLSVARLEARKHKVWVTCFLLGGSLQEALLLCCFLNAGVSNQFLFLFLPFRVLGILGATLMVSKASDCT